MGYKKTATLEDLVSARALVGIRCQSCSHSRAITIAEFKEATGIQSGLWQHAASRFRCYICDRRSAVLFPW